MDCEIVYNNGKTMVELVDGIVHISVSQEDQAWLTLDELSEVAQAVARAVADG